MAVYEYECELDGLFEKVFQMGAQPPVIKCPICHGNANRSFSGVGVIFKGNGFYKTDNR